MKILLTALFILLVGALQLSAQSTAINIQVKEAFPRYSYKYGELYIDIEEVATILKKDEQAYELVRPAKRNAAVGTGLMYVGVAMIIVPLGEIIKAGSSFQYYGAFAGIGAGLVGISLPFLNKSNKQARQAIELYNSGLSSNKGNEYKPQIYFGSTRSGTGLSLQF